MSEQERFSEIVAFLCGESDLDGRWFCEASTEEPGAFWWRRYAHKLENLYRNEADRADVAAEKIEQLEEEVERLVAERDQHKDMMEDMMTVTAIVADALGVESEPHQTATERLIEKARTLVAEVERLQRKVTDLSDEAYEYSEQIKVLRDSLERFTGNSSVQTNAPDECEQAEQALALTTPDADGGDGWRSMVKRLVNAVEALPVEDWVKMDERGNFALIGYVMQARGEWDEARTAAKIVRDNLLPADTEGA